MLEENLQLIEERILNACKLAGRRREDVKLIAVSKTKPVSMLEEAYSLGCRYFGENKVQELSEKINLLPSDIKWHMIGHLQRNKVKYLVGRVDLIHSVDSYRLAETINEESAKLGVVTNILIEVNVSGEESKYGIKPDELLELIFQISKLQNIKIKGLMTVAPATDDPEECRQYFRKLKQLLDSVNEKEIENVSMSELSMGMTGDFEIAIEEGATLIRVGTGIFGNRIYI